MEKKKLNRKLFTQKLGKRICTLRKENSLTQVQMAKMFGMPQQNISRLEAGSFTPSAFFVYEIASTFNVSSAELMDL